MRRISTWLALIGLSALLPAPLPALAQGEKTAARCLAVDGALLAAGKAGAWTNIAPNAGVPNETRIVALFGAEIQAANDGARLRMVADVGQRGLLPVLESAVSFHSNMKADLDVSVHNGIVVLTNPKKAGAAKVHVRVRGEVFDLTLEGPDAKVGIEVYGRHLPGPPNLKDAKADSPVATALFFVLAGECSIGAGKTNARLQAPPGPALLIWDSVTRESAVRRFDKLPDWVKPMTVEERKQFDAHCSAIKPCANKPAELRKSLAAALRAQDAGARKAALVALGALDDLAGVWAGLNDAEHAETRDTAILVLRHWLGRADGQSIRLAEFLTKEHKLSATQARNFLYLCHGFEETRTREASTYDLLIHTLNHPRLPARELARWHLVRLVPDGKKIAYDAAAAEPQRLQAIAAWRVLVPEGELPMRKPPTP